MRIARLNTRSPPSTLLRHRACVQCTWSAAQRPLHCDHAAAAAAAARIARRSLHAVHRRRPRPLAPSPATAPRAAASPPDAANEGLAAHPPSDITHGPAAEGLNSYPPSDITNGPAARPGLLGVPGLQSAEDCASIAAATERRVLAALGSQASSAQASSSNTAGSSRNTASSGGVGGGSSTLDSFNSLDTLGGLDSLDSLEFEAGCLEPAFDLLSSHHPDGGLRAAAHAAAQRLQHLRRVVEG